ncbi:hypothetical protein PVK06_044610 [Gossypium arboreum]|uniref:Uncharacterized protein n=1 Tax=Gossypium arboreum TaxID=29729 RepID=A0ABR0MRS8_GOSAR|nr:hypothetical protein PVK06_044610 [Gossypium arboreum]
MTAPPSTVAGEPKSSDSDPLSKEKPSPLKKVTVAEGESTVVAEGCQIARGEAARYRHAARVSSSSSSLLKIV